MEMTDRHNQVVAAFKKAAAECPVVSPVMV
jgi:hypothetical protein